MHECLRDRFHPLTGLQHVALESVAAYKLPNSSTKFTQLGAIREERVRAPGRGIGAGLPMLGGKKYHRGGT